MVSEAAYVALHDRLRGKARGLSSEALAQKMVTNIRALQGSLGGDKVVDSFKANDEQLVDDIVAAVQLGRQRLRRAVPPDFKPGREARSAVDLQVISIASPPAVFITLNFGITHTAPFGSALDQQRHQPINP